MAMRRVLMALVAGAAVGAFGWQVGFAAEPALDTLAVCERPGSDVRSPSSTGACPSGYRKTEITETGPRTTNPAYAKQGSAPIGPGADDVPVVSMTLPPGAYVITATGLYGSFSPVPTMILCVLAGPDRLAHTFGHAPGSGPASSSMTVAHELEVVTTLLLQCSLPSGDGRGMAEWELTAVRVDGIVVPPS